MKGIDMDYYNTDNELGYVKNLIYIKYILPFNKNNDSNKNVGVELEFPILNLSKKPVEMHVINGLMDHIMSVSYGFRLLQRGSDGNIAGLINDDGDVICFDNSYNNIEFSMAKAPSISIIAKRFYLYIELIQEYLRKNNYIITGLGTNPFKEYITDSPVKIEIYNAIRSYLIKSQGDKYHKYQNFPPYLSSVQTHIDVKNTDLITAFNLYAKLDFVRAILFSNSLPFIDSGINFKKYICFRDYLWEKSGFSYNPLNVGKNDFEFTSIDQIVNSYLPRSIFIKARKGKYTSFSPIPIKDYFSDKCYNSIPEDIDTFLSFRTIELTYRGTIEVRSDCSQPLKEAFAPVAFNHGLSFKINEAISLCDTFFSEYNIKYSNSQLRNFIVSGNAIPGISSYALSDFVVHLIDISSEGLVNNSPVDNIYLKPLYNRAEELTCPAIYTKALLEHGYPLEKVILQYSNF